MEQSSRGFKSPETWGKYNWPSAAPSAPLPGPLAPCVPTQGRDPLTKAGLSGTPEASGGSPCPLPVTMLSLLLCDHGRGVCSVAAGQQRKERQSVNVPGEGRSRGWVTRDK